MNKIDYFHSRVGVLVEGDIWDRKLPDIKKEKKKLSWRKVFLIRNFLLFTAIAFLLPSGMIFLNIYLTSQKIQMLDFSIFLFATCLAFLMLGLFGKKTLRNITTSPLKNKKF